MSDICKTKRNIHHLYIHIPFCDEMSLYSNFKKVAYKLGLVKDYLPLLNKEFKNRLDSEWDIKTIFIGGGNPSILEIKNTKKLLQIIKENTYNFRIKEYTMEAYPQNIDEEKLLLWKKFGVNRISLNVHSFNNSLLKKTKRAYLKNDILRACRLIKSQKIDLSIDLTFNLPGQTIDILEEDFTYIKKIDPDHISWCSVINESNTKAEDNYDDEKYLRFVSSKLKKLGYNQYEISNYCKNNKESHHNFGYWMSNEWVGLGYGAVSFVKSNLIENKGDVTNYYPVFQKLKTKDVYEQVLLMALHFKHGLDLNNKLHYQTYIYFQKNIEKEIVMGNIIKKDGRIFLTKDAWFILNTIFLRIV